MPLSTPLRTTLAIVARLYQSLTLLSGLVTTTLALTWSAPPVSTPSSTLML